MSTMRVYPRLPSMVASASMPSFRHEGLVFLFEKRLELAVELLHLAGIELPGFKTIHHQSVALSELQLPSRYADKVVVLADETPVLGVIVELQLDVKEQKLLSWPVYQTSLRAQLGCQTLVLVVTPYRHVADWAKRPISTGPGSVVKPVVVGPDGIPVIREVARAVASPELAVLSAMAHGRGDVGTAVEIAVAASTAAAGLDEDRRLVYFDLIMVALGEAARKAFEMLPQGYEFQSEPLRRSQATGEARAVVAFLEARGLAISNEQRERITSCTDLEQLDRWIRRAATIATTDELFSE
jgi:hypothetical protein